MGEQEYLTTREFTRWAEQFDKRLEKVDSLAEKLEINSENIAVLFDRSDGARVESRRSKGVNSVIAAAVSGIVTAIFGWAHR